MTRLPSGQWDDLIALDVLVRRHLDAHPLVRATSDAPRAAVAVTVLPHRAAPHVLVLKRSFAGRNAGQWALPGGRADDGESAVETALRELEEEVGIRASTDDVAGHLDDLVTASGFVIQPVVIILREPVRMRRDPHEVHSLHPVPVRRLADPAVPRWREAVDGSAVLQMPLRHDMVIHAPTGALLWQFREVALLGRETRVTDVTQPGFTHT